eukprot:6210106-Pleurochrysis_carterae.AAC.1
MCLSQLGLDPAVTPGMLQQKRLSYVYGSVPELKLLPPSNAYILRFCAAIIRLARPCSAAFPKKSLNYLFEEPQLYFAVAACIYIRISRWHLTMRLTEESVAYFHQVTAVRFATK